MGALATALPGSTAALDLDHVQLRVVDGPPDRRSDLTAPGAAEAREPVLIPDDARDHEIHAAAGVRHPLDHVDVEDLVLRLRQQDVDDLRLADRQARLYRVTVTRGLACADTS